MKNNNKSNIMFNDNTQNTTIKILDFLNDDIVKELEYLSSRCDGYEPFFNLGYKHFLYYDNNNLVGFLSYLPDEDCKNVCEVTALVLPAYRNKGIFSSLLDTAKKHFPNFKFYGNIGEMLINSSINKRIYFVEYFMQFSYDDFLAINWNDIFDKCDNLYTFENKIYELSFDFSDDDKYYLGYFDEVDYNILNANNNVATNDIINNTKNISLININLDEPVCVCNLDYQMSFTNIYGVFTENSLRHKGLGYALIYNLIYDYFDNDDTSNKPLVLNVSSNNKNAFKLYKKCDFKEQNRINYYYI